MVLGWCFRQEQRDAVWEWRRWLARDPCLPCPSSLGDVPSLSTHGRYSWAKLALWPDGGPFPPPGICPPPPTRPEVVGFYTHYGQPPISCLFKEM